MSQSTKTSGHVLAQPPRALRPGPSCRPEWARLIELLWTERDSLVTDFLSRFSAASYGEAQVPAEDVYRTAVDTMDMFLYLMAGQELPPDLRTLPHDVATRRARQGVPLDAFLQAVRNDFRVLWKGLERVASNDGIAVLVSNMDQVLDIVEGYLSSIQQAFAEEEALLARDQLLYRQRLLSRLFNAEPPKDEEVADLAKALGVRSSDTFEMLAVVGESIPRAQRQYESDQRAYCYEDAGTLYLFRSLRKGRSWMAEPPDFAAGYMTEIAGLAQVPPAAVSALALARHSRPGGGLATVAESWMGMAGRLLEATMPGFTAGVHHALDGCTPHERQRLLQVLQSYSRTGSIKETAQELYCHRNTVVNRLRALSQIIGLDVTVPAESAQALIALSLYDSDEG